MSGRRKASLWGMVFGYAAILVALVRNIALVPLYLHFVSVSEYGAWLATGGALALMLISDFGVAGVVMQRVAAAAGADDRSALGPLIGASLAMGLVLALLLSALSILLTPFMSIMPGLSGEEHRRVVNCFVIAVGSNALGVFAATALGIVRSLQWQQRAGIIAIASDLVGIGVTVAALEQDLGLYGIAAGLAARALIQALAALWAVVRSSHHLEGVRIAFSPAALRSLAGDSTRFFLSAIAMKVQTQANTLFLAFVLGPASAAVYGLTVRAHETVLQLIYQINGALVPATTHLYGAGEYARFRALILRLLPGLGFITAVGMTVVAASDESFVRLWVGAGRFGGQVTCCLMALALWVSSLGSVAYDALLAQGQFSTISRVYSLSSAVHMLLLLGFLRLGMAFAPLATLLSSSMWSFWFWSRLGAELRIERDEWKGLARMLTGILLGAAVIVALFGAALPQPDTWAGFVFQAVACTLAFVGLTLLTQRALLDLLRDELATSFRALVAR